MRRERSKYRLWAISHSRYVCKRERERERHLLDFLKKISNIPRMRGECSQFWRCPFRILGIFERHTERDKDREGEKERVTSWAGDSRHETERHGKDKDDSEENSSC